MYNKSVFDSGRAINMKKSTSSYLAARRLGLVNPGGQENNNDKTKKINKTNLSFSFNIFKGTFNLKSMVYILFKAPIIAIDWIWNETKYITLTLCLVCLPLLMGYTAMLWGPYFNVNIWEWAMFSMFAIITLFINSWIFYWCGLLKIEKINK